MMSSEVAMAPTGPAQHVLQAPLGDLERALIDTFIHARGFDDETLAQLPLAEHDALLKEASVYASARLAEVEARSHYVDRLHRS
jgi:hypothetical protein